MVWLIIFVPWAIITLWWWVSLVYYLKHKEPLGATSDFGIKILTVGKDLKTLQATVRRCPKEPLVISKNHVDVPNSKTSPPGFKAKAQYKGKDLEWARQEHPCYYTLYLDEDSQCGLWESIPNATMVQFKEVPYGSWLVEMVEAHRIGFQVEQALFEKTKPLYLWGGGFAVKQWLEDKITWDRYSITEDTGFVFSIDEPYDFRFTKQEIYNKAPLNLKDLVFQRWRWASGTYHDARNIKNPWRKAFVYFRTFTWGGWVIYATLIPVVFALNPLLVLPFVAQAMVWSLVGSRLMHQRWYTTIAVTLLAPLASYINSIGATLALFCPVKGFRVTPKEV